jgi:hypothetical protein
MKDHEFTTEEYLNALMSVHKGNIQIISALADYFNANVDASSLQLVEGKTIQDANNVIVKAMLDDVLFPCLEASHIFHNQPLQCVKWVKGVLSRYEEGFREFLRGLLVVMLNDEKRFYKETNGLLYVREEVAKLNSNKLTLDDQLHVSMLTFFTKEGSHPAKEFYDGWFGVRGLLKNQKDVVREFLNENKELVQEELSSELIKSVKLFPDIMDKTSTIIEILNEYQFTQYVERKGLKVGRIREMLNAHSGKEFIPYSMALIVSIDYFKFFRNEYFTTKEAAFKKLSEVFKAPKRRIKGNINIIAVANSEEDPTEYTSYQYLPTVEKELKGRL